MTFRLKLAAMIAVAGIAWSSGSAKAWHAAGHMMVAAVAWDQMTPTARARAIELLKLNPDYNSWIAGVADAEKDKTAFMRAATWPDDIKNPFTHAGFRDDGETPTDPNASANLGYTDKLMHKYWHYIDLPFSPDKTKLIQPQTPNGETQIRAFRSAIAGTASDDVKSYDIAWLIHLVGDVHQPLHATSRFTKLFKKGDNGGNNVKIKCSPNDCGANLHSFWDGLMDANKTPAAMIAAAAALPKAPASAAAQADPRTWINESFAIAKKSVYRAPIGTKNTTFTLSKSYQTAAMTIGRARIALAGARLARLFNDNLK